MLLLLLVVVGGAPQEDSTSSGLSAKATTLTVLRNPSGIQVAPKLLVGGDKDDGEEREVLEEDLLALVGVVQDEAI